MDAGAIQLINDIVQNAAQPAQLKTEVGAAITRRAMDVEQQIVADLLAGLPNPQPHLGNSIDGYA